MNKPLAKVSDSPVECGGRRQDFLVDPTEAFSQFWVKDVSRPSLMQKSSCQGSKQGDPGWSPLSLVVFGRSDTFRLANSCTPRSGGPENQRTRLISVQPELDSQLRCSIWEPSSFNGSCARCRWVMRNSKSVASLGFINGSIIILRLDKYSHSFVKRGGKGALNLI